MNNNIISKDGYPYTGIIKWDMEVVKNNIKKAKKDNSLPDFGLKRVELHPTSVCQYGCPFCYGVNFKCKQKAELSLKTIENNIFESIRNNRKLSKSDPIIILAGLYSEPLAHSDRVELIKLLGKYNFRFGIYTNGGFLSSDVAKAICDSAKQNRDKRLSYISFNVVAPLIHGHFNSLKKTLRDFIEMRNSLKAPIQLNIPILVDGSLSSGKLEKLQDKLLKIGVDKIRYSVPQVPISNNKIDAKNIKLIKNLQRKARENVLVRSVSGRQFEHCYVIAHTVSIDHLGYIYPCSQTCSTFFGKFSYGSVKEKGLTQLWNSKKHKNIFTSFDEIPIYCRCNPTDNQFNTICSALY